MIMKNNMKLILERWDKFQLNEQTPLAAPTGVKTFGDLKKVLIGIELKRKGKLVGEKAAEYFIGLIPGGSAALNMAKDAKDAFGFLKSLYAADDNFKTQTGLDSLNIDDNISKIVDDNVEVAFLKVLYQDLVKRNDAENIGDWTATVAIQDYLARTFEKNTVKK